MSRARTVLALAALTVVLGCAGDDDGWSSSPNPCGPAYAQALASGKQSVDSLACGIKGQATTLLDAGILVEDGGGDEAGEPDAGETDGGDADGGMP